MSGTKVGTEGERTGGQGGTSEVTDIFAGQQTATGEGVSKAIGTLLAAYQKQEARNSI